MSSLPHKAEVVVVGAGFAGLSSAAALVELGIDVVVVESEALPGTHSSGRNAAIARRVIDELPVAELAVLSMRTMSGLQTPEGTPIVRKTGGLMLGDEALLDRLWSLCQAVPALAADVSRLSPDEVVERVPALRGAVFAGGIYAESDGVVDIAGLLQSFLAPLRGRVYTDVEVTGIARDGTRIHGVETSAGRIATSQIIDAAGFHANRIAAMADLGPLPFDPVRRHLFTTDQNELVAPDAPWVWDGSAGYYFRREAGGLLMCACDQTRWPADAPIDTPVDPLARQWLAQKFDALVPGLREARPARAWSGLRVLTPDQRFVIGRDPRLGGFTWVAGLGGHGMTTSCGIGAIVGELFATGRLPDPFAEAFDPTRFLRAFAP
ncbi:MAG: FAD-binding oxidoreductase [Myxococcota bacterium]